MPLYVGFVPPRSTRKTHAHPPRNVVCRCTARTIDPVEKRLAPDTADVKQWTSPRKAAALAAAAAAAQGAAPLPSSSLHVVADKKPAAATTKKQPKEVAEPAEPAAAVAEPR